MTLTGTAQWELQDAEEALLLPGYLEVVSPLPRWTHTVWDGGSVLWNQHLGATMFHYHALLLCGVCSSLGPVLAPSPECGQKPAMQIIFLPLFLSG